MSNAINLWPKKKKLKNRRKNKKTSAVLRNFFRSFKFKIMFYLMSFAIAPVALLTLIENYYFGNIISDTEISSIQTQAAVMSDEMKSYETLDKARTAGQFNVYSQFASINEMRIRVIDKNLTIAHDTYEFDAGKTIINESVVLALQKNASVSRYVKNNTLIESAVIISNNKGETLGVLLLSKNISKLNTSISNIHEYSNLIMIAVISSMTVLAVFITIKFNNKTKSLKNSLIYIAGGHTDLRLKLEGEAEYIENAGYFNEILDNIAALDRSREEFVSNVSHELKTPMTSMKIIADSLLADPNTPIEVYREFMADIAYEIDRENGIIEDLLSLVRMDKTVTGLNISSVNINQLVERVMKKLTPIADRKSIELVFESIRPVEAEVDEIKLTQVVTNLIENAIKYNNNNGYVHVSINADYEFFYLRIEDNGIGIPEDSQKNVFQRFYRVDKARSRETGGTGLGLSIVKSIIVMHNGQIKLYSEPENESGENGLTVFTVKIPLKNKSKAGKNSET
ncbi:MAG: HAMP domain-containing histidine kinase [Clostridiales bacterium]|nr:HAMP domain-containing histidine kinase [Clostridiales bacterium]MBS5877244.1 HAMP domain-containing histidine kinase [Clostridiales bacterium]MDU1041950.1 HAMP domain-containing sensor histidine kinase [Clostridiales bacterium]MDU3490606.1 HAMP domain-containing sensor histidine kinase [Clostridiales bacterium]